MTGGLEDALCSAAAKGDAAQVEKLLRAGADVNGWNRFGRTPLQVMMMGNPRVALLLLKYGADPNVFDPTTGATPLHDAAQTGFLDTVRLLVRFQGNPLARNNTNQLPVDVASKEDVVSFLRSL
ncbi:cyclin-dependent kinase 4 inhibitor B-like [Gouania willdenowi]|uniref:Cyclin-dependent kinase 4 inhibitor B-like n=1 Tax=Gouania willdenowi TaxID=441366 RepID=A0A8C5D3L7_GOUWI|nr:cyclin-dependent kinase 4 inhibitor B-like [Gouania willdenowi]